MEFAT